MAERNTTHRQMGHTETNSDHAQLQFDPPSTSVNSPSFPNSHVHPLPTSSGTIPSHFIDYHRSNFSIQNQYDGQQNPQSVPNTEVGPVIPPNLIYNPYMPSSVGRWTFPANGGPSTQIPVPLGNGVRIGESDGSCQFFSNNGPWIKQKNHVEAPGNFYRVNGNNDASTTSSYESQPWQRPSEAGQNNLSRAYLNPYERQGCSYLPVEGLQHNTRSRPTAHQQEHSLFPRQSYLAQENYMERSFQPAGNVWVDQFGGSVHNPSHRNHAVPRPILPGIAVNRGSVGIGNFGNSGYQDSIFGGNSLSQLHPLLIPNRHHDLLAHGMHRNFNHHQWGGPPYGHSVNNVMHHGMLNPPSGDIIAEIGFSSQFLPNTSWRFHRHPRFLNEAAPSDAYMELFSHEDDADLQFPNFGVENSTDQHRDMRLDIDSMTYEELLDLQEHIGNVNTGLSEESILKHLVTRQHSSIAPLSRSTQSPGDSLQNATCIICLVEFEENEGIGVLDCGHEFHANCIKQWISVKNICPTCKKTALAVDKT